MRHYQEVDLHLTEKELSFTSNRRHTPPRRTNIYDCHLQHMKVNFAEKEELESQVRDYQHRIKHYLEPQIEQLTKQVTLLEACNASLCDKLAKLQRQLLDKKF